MITITFITAMLMLASQANAPPESHFKCYLVRIGQPYSSSRPYDMGLVLRITIGLAIILPKILHPELVKNRVQNNAANSYSTKWRFFLIDTLLRGGYTAPFN